MSYFDRAEVGGIMSRVQNDVQQLQEFLSIFVLALSDLVVLVGIVVAMLLMNWELALITFSVAPVLFVMMVFWQKYALRSFMRVRREVANVNSELQENISGIRVIQSLDRQDENLRQFDGANRRYVDTSMRATRLSGRPEPVRRAGVCNIDGVGHNFRRTHGPGREHRGGGVRLWPSRFTSNVSSTPSAPSRCSTASSKGPWRQGVTSSRYWTRSR